MYTDIHSHVIWGVDDGAEEREDTFRMLRAAAADGISTIICTPHVTPGVYEFPEETFREHFAEAEEYIRENGLGITLHTGAEILYTDYMSRFLREKKVMTLAGSSYVLVEFLPTDTKDHIYDALQKVANSGYRPVIAHMERYPAIRTLDQVREMKSRFHALVQINCRSLIRKQPLLRRSFFDGLFREDLADFIGTDTHAFPGRETCMTESMKALAEKYGRNTAERIEKKPEIILK